MYWSFVHRLTSELSTAAGKIFLALAFVFVRKDMKVQDHEARELIMLAATSEARQVDDWLALTICRLLSGHGLDDSMLAVKLSSTKTGKT